MMFDCVTFVIYLHPTYSSRSVFFVCFFWGILFDYIHYSQGYFYTLHSLFSRLFDTQFYEGLCLELIPCLEPPPYCTKHHGYITPLAHGPLSIFCKFLTIHLVVAFPMSSLAFPGSPLCLNSSLSQFLSLSYTSSSYLGDYSRPSEDFGGEHVRRKCIARGGTR